MNWTLSKPLLLAGAAFLALIVTVLVVIATRAPKVPDFQSFEAGPERKTAFFEYLLPLIRAENMEVRELRAQLLNYRKKSELSGRARKHLQRVAERYRLPDFDAGQPADWEALLQRVDIVPPSLALAQAANESAWGTSRFARKGYNFYGQWCFEKGCGLVPSSRDSGKTHEVAAFDSPRESVAKYIANLNRHAAYRPLRQIRAKLRDSQQAVTGIELAAGLERYSERGEAYIKELRSMIRYNQLTRYDSRPHPEQAG